MAKIQNVGEYEGGQLKNWAWVEGLDNPADWTTKPEPARELRIGSFWQTGPNFLGEEVKDWPIKLLLQTDVLEGELVSKTAQVFMLAGEETQGLQFLSSRHNSVDKLHRILAYILRWSNLGKLTSTK